ncbi:Pleckstrin homology-like domain [Lasallia pustulata]|uniref:Pleckstrin homology-like domain n=1 Tax=Lasallia pustulata TaxID=136370 RepID=A0A1W5DAU5_9LECA|nr:Pleckstrin homology-like domain [Lasallia pustulata]
MGRSSRVLSFMSAFGGPPRSPTPASSPSNPPASTAREEVYSSSSPHHLAGPARDSPPPARTKVERSPSSRPMSMIQTYQPPLMEIAQDTIPELQPIFTFLNSHSNKLYQEGYFLKLHDLDSLGRPNADRSWTECFAQLVGTVLSLWDAGALDAAGEDGEVAPTFINLADASIKMIETLPTRSQGVQPLQNVLSVSTAGKNRYLFHFNSLHSLTQWTAGIRLAMFEHATLQEAYTGSLIAGKGKSLNNINVIMDRTRLKTEDWARVRFGAGTPWRRCWCVISPPDEKEIQKQQKSLKKRSAYDRSFPILKGDIKFYDTRKIKKARPIATITDAYSAYAIYPQSKPLIDQSTLVKVEGIITIHSAPETITEGFVFVMPEVHPAVTGFEMMLRWLFPVYDVFGLYGRPNRLVADTLDVRSLMFAMPQEKRYGYLEILDVAGLIHSEGSQLWKEKDWRKQLKELTANRITSLREGSTRSRIGSRASSNRGYRNSLPGRNGNLRFDDNASIRSSPSIRHDTGTFAPPLPTGSAPPGNGPFQPPRTPKHQRSVSDATAFSTPRHQRSISEAQQNYTPSRLSHEATPSMMPSEAIPPPPPVHRVPVDGALRNGSLQRYAAELEGANERSSSESERRYRGPMATEAEVQGIRQDLQPNSPPAPVVAPPAFAHQPGDKPPTKPYHSAELRRANSRMSTTTLSQLAEAGNFQNPEGIASAGAAAAWRTNQHQQEVGAYSEDHQRGVNDDASKSGMIADHSSVYEGMVLAEAGSTSSNTQPLPFSTNDSPPHFEASSSLQNSSPSQSESLLPPSPRAQRSASPLSQSSTYSSSPPEQLSLKVVKNFSRLPPQQPSQDLQSQTTKSDSTTIVMKPPPAPLEPERPDMLKRHSTSHSITRKPVPGQTQQTNSQEQPALLARSSLESLRQHAVDQDALEDAIPGKSLHSTRSNGFDARRRSDISSNYDDDSIVSPDYASTRKSMETSGSIEKPRIGVLKTVGTVEADESQVQVGDVRYRADQRQGLTADIPSIDFGPTHALNPGFASRPPTGNVGQSPYERTVSAERQSTANQLNGGPIYTSRTNPGRPDGPGHSRSSSRNLVTPELDQGRSSPADVSSERPRSVAWQPGTTIGSSSPGSRQSITPEQFVQQRAASGRVTPIYAHATKTAATPPPVTRNSSGDWSQQQGRLTPTKELPRPQSRVVAPMVNPSAGDYTARLSAREQEHVARVTGSPFISVPRQSSQGGGGLIAAIEAREREKKDMREGLGGQMVQNAIAQRQQQVQGHQYAQQSQPQTPSYQYSQQAFPSPSPLLAMPGQYPQTPQVPNPGRVQPQYGGWSAAQTSQYNPQQQQQWVSPAAQLYWSAPQAPSPYSQEQYQQGQYQQGQYQQGQFQQGHQQNGSYFGNAHVGR